MDELMVVVAERFKWPPSEIKALTLDELTFWAQSALMIYDEEAKAVKKR